MVMLETSVVDQGEHANERPQMRLPEFKHHTKGGLKRTCKEFFDSSLGIRGSLNGAPSSHQDGSEKRRHGKTKSDCVPSPDHQRSNDTNVPPSNRDTVPPTPRKLKRFEKSASHHEMRRYSDLKNRLESPLLEYMYKYSGAKRPQLSPIALRPVILGTTLDDAKLWMVILCDKNLEGRATKFLKQQWVHELCNLSDPSQTNIEILVAGSIWPVSRIIAQLPLRPDKTQNHDWTFCGIPMCFFDTDSHSIRVGTLGGPLHVLFNDGSSTLMGMTSGHVIQSFGGGHSNGPDVDNGDSISDSESESELSNRSPVHGGTTNTSQALLNFEQFKPAVQIRASLWESSSAMLPIVMPENTQGGVEKYYDWTLVQLNDMPLPKQHRTGYEKPLRLPTRTVLEHMEEVPVIVLSAEGRKPGYLYAMPARLQMHPGNSFINTHLMRLRENYCELVS